MEKNSVHFIGIAGNTMAPFAKMFKEMGWEVTGSDQSAVFPPVTDYLKKNNLPLICGYKKENLPKKPTLVVVGRSALLVNQENPEVEAARNLDCPVLSYPEVLGQYLVKNNSIVVAGTYGKTTTTALIAWILEKAGLNPSYMIGALPLNFEDGVRNTDSVYSVVEGDETPAMSEKDPSKFLYYKPKYLLLTAAKWDHPEVYKTEECYLEAFQKLINLIPEDGLIVACREGDNLEKITRTAKARVIWYSSNDKSADFALTNIEVNEAGTSFKVNEFSLKTDLIGKHNLQNITGAVALCSLIGVDKDSIVNAVSSFKGITNRQEKLGEYAGITMYSDFAQHPFRVKETLAAFRERYPKNRIIAVLNPHSSLLQQKESLNWYVGNFDLADQVVVAKVTFPKNKTKEEWVKGSDIVKAIARTQRNVFYEPQDEKLVDYLVGETKSGEILIFLTSGGLRMVQLIEEVKQRLKEKENERKT